jgi:glycosyltransferase involved in cell wall biosynthesis
MSEPGVVVLNVISLLPHVNFPGFRSGLTLENWWRATFPSVRREISRRGFSEASVLFFDSPLFFPLAQAAGIRSVYRYADRMSEFNEVTPAMLRLQDRVFQEADLVIHTARALKADFASRTGPSLYLPNGVDVDAYETVGPEPDELSAIPRPRIVYSGAVERWFNSRLVVEAARRMTDVHFVLIGRVSSGYAPLKDQPNIHLLGQKPFSRIPEFLGHCQVGIIPFDKAGMPELVEAINPLKLYEYCAAGLPVVGYQSEEIAALDAPVSTFETANGFVQALRRELASDGPAKKESRRRWAAAASWDKRTEELEHALDCLRSDS